LAVVRGSLGLDCVWLSCVTDVGRALWLGYIKDCYYYIIIIIIIIINYGCQQSDQPWSAAQEPSLADVHFLSVDQTSGTIYLLILNWLTLIQPFIMH